MSLKRFLHRRYWDEERARELEAYLEEETNDNIARGMPPEEARRAAHLKLGSATRIREEIYRMNSLGWLETFWQDLRFALRMLRKNPGFTVVAVFTLALGIGAATAIFNATDQALFSPLPLPSPNELVAIYNLNKQSARYVSTSYPDYEDFNSQNRCFQQISAYVRFPLNLTIGDDTERVPVEAVTADYFAMLKLPPLLGRALGPEDAQPSGSSSVAMIGENLWRERFGGDRGLIGKAITLENHPLVVVGIVPKSYQGVNLNWGEPPQVWVPVSSIPQLIPRFKERGIFNQRAARWLVMLGRLKKGISVEQAQSQLRLVAANLARADPASDRDITVAAFPASRSKFWPAYRGRVTHTLAVFMLGAGLVLLLACANVSNLLLERAFARRREIAIRIAVGAGRGRLIRQLLAENLLLAALAFPAALMIIHVLNGVLARFPGAFGLPLALDLGIGGRVLLFGFMLSLATIVLFGLAPAFQSTRPDVAPWLKESGNAPLPGRHQEWMRRSLVVLQVAFSMLLLVVGGIFVRSVLKAYQIDFGFRPAHLLLMSYDPPQAQLWSQGLSQTVLQRISSLPGVETATLAWDAPFTIESSMSLADPENRGLEPISTVYNMVGPDFLKTMGIGIVAGRDFTWRDNADAPKVAVVNQTLAERLGLGANPVGRTVTVIDSPGHSELVEVIGLVRDSKYVSVWESRQPYIYFAAWQWPFPAVNLLVRTRGEPLALAPEVRRGWHEAFPGVPLYGLHSGEEAVRMALAPERLAAVLLGSFAVIAALVAAIGLYGVVAFSVSRQKREIGIRMAIGATPGMVVHGILNAALILTGAGLAVGAAAGCVAMRFVAPLVKGVSPYDALTFTAVAVLLCVASAVAAFIPALRATRGDPLSSLRAE